MDLVFWRSEGPEEARQRRLCRKMLMLAPEPEYDHVCSGLATLGALSLLLIGAVVWRLGHLGTAAPALTTLLVLAGLAATVLQNPALLSPRRRRRPRSRGAAEPAGRGNPPLWISGADHGRRRTHCLGARKLGPCSLTRTCRPVTELAATGGYARLC